MRGAEKEDPNLIYSQPTMCLYCHLIVEMTHEVGADPISGAWACSKCGHLYPFSKWKIRKRSRRRD